jgi:ribose 1,5-bisphosphokinase
MTQGYLFYLIGPSGAGKDALLAHARQQIGGHLPVLFAHRYITRPSQAGGENYIALTQAEFDQRQQRGLFALSWQSHHYSYGLGIEIEGWMRAGLHVVVNGSREYLPVASRRFAQMRVILLEVSPEVIRQRLEERGRETADEIDARIAHNQQLPAVSHPHLHVLDNNTPLADTGARFIELLKA